MVETALSTSMRLAQWRELGRQRGTPTILLVRHGETPWNAERRFLGKQDQGLSTRGREQAHLLQTCLAGRLQGVVTSPLRRARETARGIALDVQEEASFAEMDQGELEGLSVEEALRSFPEFFAAWAVDPEQSAAPGGESLGAVRRRAWEGLLRLHERYRPGDVVMVVSHQMVIASLTCTVLGVSLDRWREHRVGNTQATVVQLGAQPRVLETRILFSEDGHE